MIVIVDVEWVQENNISTITQLAAARLSDDWETVESIERLVRPPEWQVSKWTHMAYSGFSADEFRSGVDEKVAISDFAEFLKDDDTVLCWHKDTKRLLTQKMLLHTGKEHPAVWKVVNGKVYSIAREKGIPATSMYEVAKKLGLTMPLPKHCSSNDVCILQSLLSELKYEITPTQTAVVKTPTDIRERNRDIVSRAGYGYIFSPTSNVFHRPTCHLALSARDINGCKYYNTAAKKRVPCKVCRPDLAATYRPIKERNKQPSGPKKEIIRTRLLGDQWIDITNLKIVGYCHNRIHPGKLTRKILEEHDCLGKNCKFFEKYPESTYWAAEENRRKQKEKRKQARQAEKMAAQQLEEELSELKELFQSYADDAGYSMLIVRLEKERRDRYRVFYVSDNPFADGNRFPDFLETIRFFFPEYSINLRHIKDVDGRFVTVEEYLARVKSL